MAIDFSLPPDIVALRTKIREFIDKDVEPVATRLEKVDDRSQWGPEIIRLRKLAREKGLWLPHMPKEFGGMELGALGIATVSAECGRVPLSAFIINCQAPDEGNMHTLLHFATPAQKEKYLRPLCNGFVRSCFAMTEPEVAGSDPTGIQTFAVRQGDHWHINGHKWFISGARGAKFAILIACTDPDADPPQARNSAFIVDLPRSHLGLPPMVTSQATKEEADAVRWQWLADKLASLELNAEKVDAKLAAAEAKVGLWQFACVILGILLTALAVNVFVR